MSTVGTQNAGVERIAAAFAGSGKRAALMPYLMGGFPDLPASQRIGEAYADGGADLVELGVPFSDPLADGPVIQAAGSRALAAGATVPGVLTVAEALAARLPVVLMCYANLVLARGVERFCADLAAAGGERPDRAGPAARGGRRRAGRLRGRRPRARAPRRPDDPGRPPDGDRRAGARLPLHGVGHRHDGRARDAVGHVRRRRGAGEGAHGRSRSRWASGSRRRSTPSQAADAGADGVIVGSRLVRAAGESEDPAGAVREVVAGMADALR